MFLLLLLISSVSYKSSVCCVVSVSSMPLCVFFFSLSVSYVPVVSDALIILSLLFLPCLFLPLCPLWPLFRMLLFCLFFPLSLLSSLFSFVFGVCLLFPSVAAVASASCVLSVQAVPSVPCVPLAPADSSVSYLLLLTCLLFLRFIVSLLLQQDCMTITFNPPRQ